MADAGGSSSLPDATAKPPSAAAAAAALPNRKNKSSSSSSSSSSSIGVNSDDDNAPGDEAESQLVRSAAGIGNLDALEDALPIRKGLSEHHSGRTKSYFNLADASADSSIAKPADPYSKKRKIKIARNLRLEELRQGRVSKKPTNDSRTTAPLLINAGKTGSQDDDKTDESSSSDDEEEEIARV
uniref:Uncharacterized protein n=1 Tax=Kalanchoe fedtschenkoi TaxID=63787 RepID=A0A7N0SWD6_KALFE